MPAGALLQRRPAARAVPPILELTVPGAGAAEAAAGDVSNSCRACSGGKKPTLMLHAHCSAETLLIFTLKGKLPLFHDALLDLWHGCCTHT